MAVEEEEVEGDVEEHEEEEEEEDEDEDESRRKQTKKKARRVTDKDGKAASLEVHTKKQNRRPRSQKRKDAKVPDRKPSKTGTGAAGASTAASKRGTSATVRVTPQTQSDAGGEWVEADNSGGLTMSSSSSSSSGQRPSQAHDGTPSQASWVRHGMYAVFYCIDANP